MRPVPHKARFALVVSVAILLGIAGIYAVGDAILAPAPISASPGLLETLLASRAVVAAVRIAAIFAAAFVVASVVALISKRQWPTRIGPVQIAGDVSELEAENERLRTAVANSSATIGSLKREGAVKDHVADRRTGSR